MSKIAIIGGGIVGLSAAYAIQQKMPGAEITVIEKENRWAAHQSGNNSGVIHSGIYYKPGSLKARFAKEGGEALIAFSQKYGIRHERCGKVIVAVNERELPLLKNLYERGIQNRLNVRMISREELQEREPYVNGLEAIHVKETGIIDYVQVCNTLAEILKEGGARLLLQTEVQQLHEDPAGIEITMNNRHETFDYAVNCAGLFSDRITKSAGILPDCKIVPFRGEYYKLRPEKRHFVQNLVYPVPNPNFPFLGVHLTRMVNGEVEVGPNAVLGFKREGYKKTDIDLGDLAEVLTYKGFWKLALKYWKEGLNEMARSYSKTAFLKSLNQLLPDVTEDDLIPASAGVRAQALRSDGALIDDFFIINSKRSVHVCNAPSPAATACLPIGEEIASRLARLMAKSAHHQAV
jgi:L-2-hydroxyglutarate oxidase